MKRLAAVLVVASAASIGGVATAGAASADVCVDVTININGQGAAEQECISTTPPAVPGV